MEVRDTVQEAGIKTIPKKKKCKKAKWLPDELWTEARDIVQETGIKIIPKKKKCKKAKWLSEKALQIAEKRIKVKGKGKRERYIQLNAESQRIPRAEKQAFLSEP